MTPEKSLETFRSFLQKHNLQLEELSAAQCINLMIDFYLQQRCVNCVDYSEDGDMLLFQFGNNGDYFVFNITRQFILEEEDQEGPEEYVDQIISQLSLTIYYDATENSRQLVPTSKWCNSPAHVKDFLEFINESEAMVIARRSDVRETALLWQLV